MTIAQRIGQLASEAETRARSAEFTAIAKYLMLGKGKATEAAAFASQRRATDRVVSVLKDASPGTLGDPD